jgi:AAA+ superfamily predicted ATPase
MIESSTRPRSAAAMLASLRQFSDAGGCIVQIKTREPLRAAIALRQEYVLRDQPYTEWTSSFGFRKFSSDNFTNHALDGDTTDFLTAFQRPLKDFQTPSSAVCSQQDKVHTFCFLDPSPYIKDNPFVLDLIQHYASFLPVSNMMILLVTSEDPLPVPAGLTMVTSLHTPTAEELLGLLQPILDRASEGEMSFARGHDITPEGALQIAHLGLGLTFLEFEQHVALTVIRVHSRGSDILTLADLLEGIAEGKTEVVRQSDLLELVRSEDMANVGGMGRLKDWISMRRESYSEKAREFGIEAPKGVVVAGVPGTGKSLVAKAVGSALGIPVVRLDIGRIFSKYVGDSEARMRGALSMVEQMAPVVLFVDEIDKGLGGTGGGGGGDAGTSMRVLGTYLTWLQDLRAPVFNMVTANRVEGLPPELLRRGRFDQIFSLGLPTATERREVLRIHLSRRGWAAEFQEASWSQFDTASMEYVPAEIEGAVKDALILAFHEGKDLGMSHILRALKEIVPMAKSNAVRIAEILQWAANNAVPVSYAEGEKEATAAPTTPRTRLIRPRQH